MTAIASSLFRSVKIKGGAKEADAYQKSIPRWIRYRIMALKSPECRLLLSCAVQAVSAHPVVCLYKNTLRGNEYVACDDEMCTFNF